MADQKANSAAIAQFGSALGPQVLAASRALYADVQQPLLDAQPAIARDCAYGPHPRHRLDLYRTGEASALRPVVLFVHGGGFVQGDKSADGWPNAAVGRWAAGQGWLGAVMNYRLAPDHGWYQLYSSKDEAISEDLIKRTADAGLKTLVFTVDVPEGSTSAAER